MSSHNRSIAIPALKLFVAIVTKLLIDNPQISSYAQHIVSVVQPCVLQTLETTEGLSKF